MKDYDILVPVSIIKKLLEHEMECSDEYAILSDEEFDVLVQAVDCIDNQNSDLPKVTVVPEKMAHLVKGAQLGKPKEPKNEKPK